MHWRKVITTCFIEVDSHEFKYMRTVYGLRTFKHTFNPLIIIEMNNLICLKWDFYTLNLFDSPLM